MQSPTHFLVGIAIYELILWVFPTLPLWAVILITIPLAVGSHVLLDCLAKMTYHPPEPRWKDPFWVSYHVIFVYIGTLIMVILLFLPYWWVMAASVLPDIIDWYTLRPLFKKGPVVHPYIDKVRAKLFGYLPDWTDKPWTVSLEIGFDVILALILFL